MRRIPLALQVCGWRAMVTKIGFTPVTLFLFRAFFALFPAPNPACCLCCLAVFRGGLPLLFLP